eukprot:1176612-Prorocentrum_minimum.AAC.5
MGRSSRWCCHHWAPVRAIASTCRATKTNNAAVSAMCVSVYKDRRHGARLVTQGLSHVPDS